ncbi:MAG: DUF1345 domain-containing protein [Burkholderiaceae bacterium]|jgi:uncharacterized membrane protein
MNSVTRFIRLRIRLCSAALASGLLWLVLPPSWNLVQRLLVAWNAGVYLFLALIWLMMVRTSQQRMQHCYEEEDDSVLGTLILVCLGAIASFVAVVVLLGGKDVAQSWIVGRYMLTALTILGAWFLVPTVFTLHYADLYYSAPKNQRPLALPEGKPDPDYWDFIYYSFTIAAASQTSDVVTRSTPMRRATVAQSVLSFFFNATVLGFAINVAAGLLGK